MEEGRIKETPKSDLRMRSLYSLYGAPVNKHERLRDLFCSVEGRLLSHNGPWITPWAMRYGKYRETCARVAEMNYDLILMLQGEAIAGKLRIDSTCTSDPEYMASPILDFGNAPSEQSQEVIEYRKKLASIFNTGGIFTILWALFYDTWLQLALLNESKGDLDYLASTWLLPQVKDIDDLVSSERVTALETLPSDALNIQ